MVQSKLRSDSEPLLLCDVPTQCTVVDDWLDVTMAEVSDGVLEDMSLASRVLEDTFSSPWPWPWPWPCEIFNDT